MNHAFKNKLKSMKNSHKIFNALQAFFAKNIEKGEKLYER